MTDCYPVYFGSRNAGSVQVIRQGLYYRFICKCRLSGEVVCRLHVRCGNSQESLGVVVPAGECFGLDTRLPIKRIGEGNLSFSLVPKHEISEGKFIAIYPDEPFAYIERLKTSYLVRRNGQLGILVKPGADL